MRKRARWGWIVVAVIALVYAVGLVPSHSVPVPPRFHPDVFFNGELDSWGVFVGWNGVPRQQFEMHAEASWEGNKGQMHEFFHFTDGTKRERQWTFVKTDDAHFIGTAPDVIGEARGVVSGDTLHWVYTINLSVGGKTRSVRFDDWLYRVDDRHVFSEISASKFGIPVGHMTMFFRKPRPTAW
jgi:hypothetical protein